MATILLLKFYHEIIKILYISANSITYYIIFEVHKVHELSLTPHKMLLLTVGHQNQGI